LHLRVSCGSRWTFGVIGLCFQVTTACRSANDVSDRIEKFLTDFRNDLEAMNKETFFEHVVSLAKDKLQMWNSLEEETSTLWSEIIENRYDFEIHRNEVECLKKITKDDVLKAFDKHLNPKNKKRRKLDIHTIGTTEGLASDGRPVVSSDDNIGDLINEEVATFRKIAGKSWGKIY
jgi:secreted Zn-dependent insulinase-like peptidase